MNDGFLAETDLQAIPAVEINPSGPPDGAPLVSVLMITWNHGAFVAQAIEGVVGQVCPFRFELLIGEDASGDETRAVCEDYQSRYPDIIRLIVAESNVGMHRNLARLWWRARGRYIALCEGDDYWTDPCEPDSVNENDVEWRCHECAHGAEASVCACPLAPVARWLFEAKDFA